MTQFAASAARDRPYPSELMLATQVTTYVSNVRNEGPRCIDPVEPTFFD